MAGVIAARWLLAAVGLAALGVVAAADGSSRAGLVALGAAAGLLAQAGWSALRLTGSRFLEATRLEEATDRVRGEPDEAPGVSGAAGLRTEHA